MSDRCDKSAEYAKKVPELRRHLFVRTIDGSASPRQAIKAMCQQCVGYEDVQEAIRGCQSSRCPLWAYRPYRSEKE